ncbi:MAG: 2-isopropylmalate synthase [Oscillatoria princeps RMCB-10]|nr:2-isopropylmalate synthase [Oscillatoria princeps RMCB-10]
MIVKEKECEMKPLVRILDATLREGEQQAGVRFTSQDKIEILHLLEDFNIDMVEVGHPGISAEDERICLEVSRAARSAEILMHSRADIAEVRSAKRAGADWVGIWASVNPIGTKTKFAGHDPDYIHEKVKAAISEAKTLGLKVRFTVEDASRTLWEDIEWVARLALAAGADIISFADTVGVLEPRTCAELVSRAVETLGCAIEVHLHNDLGLALANALAAIDAGASVVDTSILGIGERTGITDLIQLSVALQQMRGEQGFPLEKIPQLAYAVGLATGYHPDKLRPIVGRNAFTHTSKYHAKAVELDPEAYEPFAPEIVGRVRTVEKDRTPLSKPKLPVSLDIAKPFPKGSSELKYHRNGPGVRWVMMDSRVDARSSFYVIQRFIGLHGIPFTPEKHVDTHAHHCDSAFIFWGDAPDGTGLICNVQLGDEERTVESPASVFIPAGVRHAYYYVAGRGTYTNIVLAPDYNKSLL